MCGIVGIWLAANTSNDPREIAKSMAATLQHRGPDGTGVWGDMSLPIALGHRRLSIQDTTSAGQQPMISQCGRYVLVYNGELYGFRTLVKRLQHQGRQLRGHSDTEVLLETIAEQGLATTLKEVKGMFALALWDLKQRTLSLARDPIGIKPLYYGWRNRTFLFGSELKAIRSVPGFERRRNHLAVSEYCKFGYIPAPLSIEEDIYKLLPGHIVTISDSSTRVESTSFWSLLDDAFLPGYDSKPRESIETSDFQLATNRLDELLTEVIEEHLISDVPLGAFLSGGIDSSLVVAFMQKVNQGKTQTFSIGFDRPEYDESNYASAVAEHLKTQHHQWIVTSEEAQEVIPRLVEIYDEPFADSSQIPTYLVSQFAGENVTVALSGDGGDEFFGGYRRYPYFYNLWNKVNRLPRMARIGAGKSLGFIARFLPVQYRDAAMWRAQMLGIDSFPECYERFNRHWKFTSHLLTNDFLSEVPAEPRQAIVPYAMLPAGFARSRGNDADSIFAWMMLHDAQRYLPDDILTKVDRASMACSLETRVPLLDKRVVQFSCQLPAVWKQGRDPSELAQNGKVILRELLSRYLPRSLYERPKVGFGVPLDQWLRGPLRDWAEALLDKKRLREQGVFQVDTVHRFWDSHIKQKADWEYLLWDVLMFQAFEEKQ